MLSLRHVMPIAGVSVAMCVALTSPVSAVSLPAANAVAQLDAGAGGLPARVPSPLRGPALSALSKTIEAPVFDGRGHAYEVSRSDHTLMTVTEYALDGQPVWDEQMRADQFQVGVSASALGVLDAFGSSVTFSATPFSHAVGTTTALPTFAGDSTYALAATPAGFVVTGAFQGISGQVAGVPGFLDVFTARGILKTHLTFPDAWGETLQTTVCGGAVVVEDVPFSDRQGDRMGSRARFYVVDGGRVKAYAATLPPFGERALPGAARFIAVSPTQVLMFSAVGGPGVELYDLADRRTLWADPTAGIGYRAADGDGEALFVSVGRNNAPYVLDLRTGRILAHPTYHGDALIFLGASRGWALALAKPRVPSGAPDADTLLRVAASGAVEVVEYGVPATAGTGWLYDVPKGLYLAPGLGATAIAWQVPAR